MACSSVSARSRPQVSARWDGPWPSIESSTGLRVPGTVPERRSRRQADFRISRIVHLHRHHMWYNMRYVVQLGGTIASVFWKGYSRKILAGMVSPHQDLTAVLQILYAALSEYGCPEVLVSDNGSVFTLDTIWPF